MAMRYLSKTADKKLETLRKKHGRSRSGQVEVMCDKESMKKGKK